MPQLRNAKHEAVLQAYIADPARVGWKAYRAVYRKSSRRASETAWSRLLKDAEFSARCAELTDAVTKAATAAAAMDLTEVLVELSKLGRANMRDFIRISGDGDPVLDFSALTREQAAAIQELTVETYMDGGGEDAREVKRVKFRLHSKPQALSELRKHFEPQRHEVTGKDGGPIETKELSELEAARRMAFLLTRAAKAKKGKPS